MTNNTHTEEQLQTQAPSPLTEAERALLWKRISAGINHDPVLSPYLQHFFLTTKTMIPLIVALAVLLSAGGTVAASNDARPGDVLYPLDRAIEDFKLSVASKNDKDELRIKFANERLHEFDSIAEEELGDDSLSGVLTEAEAHIFTNETIVKLEVGDKKFVFATDADTREEIIDEIITKYPELTKETVESVLVVETEDRESSADDEEGVPESAKLRLEHAFNVLSAFVADTAVNASTSPGVVHALEVIQARLLERSGELPKELRVRVKDDEARFEVKDEHGKFRVELKDGEVRIKQEDEDEHEDDGDEDEVRHASSTSSVEQDDDDEDEAEDSHDDDSNSNDDSEEDEEDDDSSSGKDDSSNSDDDSGDDNSGHGSDE